MIIVLVLLQRKWWHLNLPLCWCNTLWCVYCYSKGDVALLNCTAIVNTSNETLTDKNQISDSIHRIAGPELRNELYKLKGRGRYWVGKRKMSKTRILVISFFLQQFICKGSCTVRNSWDLHPHRIVWVFFLQDVEQGRQNWQRASTWPRDLSYIQLAPNIKPSIAQLPRAPYTAAIEMSCNLPSKYYIT